MIIASNAPDLDIVSAFSGGGVGYLAAHRGATHGLLGIVLLAGASLLAVLIWRMTRSGLRSLAPRDVLVLGGLTLLGTGLHVLMDLPTSYGTRVLSPLDRTWYAVDWLPIIEVYLWALLVLGLVAMRGRPRLWSRIGRTVIVLALGLYTLRALAHQRALDEANARDGRGAPAPCAEAATWVRHPTVFEAPRAGPGACLRAAALPTFLSPFTWRLVRQHPGGYELREWSALSGTTDAGAVWVPSETDAWVAAARRAPVARVFLNFARFPASRSAVLPDGSRRIRFVDVRFVGSPFGLTPDPEARAPFLATVELSPDGLVLDQRLGP